MKILNYLIKPKTLLIVLTVFVTAILALYFFNTYVYRSKAAGETITVTMSSADNIMTLQTGATKVVNVDLTPSDATKRISGFDLTFATTGPLIIQSIGAPQNIGGDSSIFTNVLTSGNRVVYVIKKPDSELPVKISVPITVQSTGLGEARLKLNFSDNYRVSNSQVSGNISGNIYGFDPTKVQELVFNPSPTGEIPSLTPPTTPPITSPAGNTTLNFKLKFQGITTGNIADAYKTMAVKIILKTRDEAVATRSANFSVDVNGIWSGTTNVDLTSGAGSVYSILIKGPMHIQRKICTNMPKETSPGTYSCGVGTISLSEGENNLDFSGIMMMAGDLPLPQTGGQDGIADAVDIGYIINNLGKTDDATVAIADLNRNGGVDAADFSIEQFALSLRPDEQ